MKQIVLYILLKIVTIIFEISFIWFVFFYNLFSSLDKILLPIILIFINKNNGLLLSSIVVVIIAILIFSKNILRANTNNKSIIRFLVLTLNVISIVSIIAILFFYFMSHSMDNFQL